MAVVGFLAEGKTPVKPTAEQLEQKSYSQQEGSQEESERKRLEYTDSVQWIEW